MECINSNEKMAEHSEYFKKLMNDLQTQIDKTAEPQKFKSPGTYEIVSSEKKISKKKLLEKLLEKYPYTNSKFDKINDRDQIQYRLLVSTKNLLVAEFVLKWECENKKRIPKKLAWEILTKVKNNESINLEFLNQLKQKYY